MTKSSTLLIIFFLLAAPLLMHGQAVGTDVLPPASIKVTPPSPTAAAIARFGNTPVNYYTGQPNISIELFSITSGELTLPLTLSYQADGLRVADRGSWVGLGWSLQAGGVVSRTALGRPDEAGAGFLSVGKYYAGLSLPNTSTISAQLYNSLTKATTGQWDAEPDLFTYHSLNLAGKFVHDSLGRIVPEQQSDVLIESGLTQGAGNRPFVIVDDKGCRHVFGEQEFTLTHGESDDYYPSSWYLSRLEPVVGTPITFVYSTSSLQIPHIQTPTETQTVTWRLDQSPTVPISSETIVKPSSISVQEKVLTGIRFAEGEVAFYSSEIAGYGRRLDSVELRTRAGQVLKRFVLRYEQRAGSGSVRFLLTSVQQYADDHQEALPPHRLEYAPGTFPALNSMALDYWGFYNGAPNTTLRPTYQVGTASVTGADRQSQLSKTKTGVLTKISYPTGGYTAFDYELHDYGFVENLPYVETSTVWASAFRSAQARIECDDNSCPVVDGPYADTVSFFLNATQLVNIQWLLNNTTRSDHVRVSLTGPNLPTLTVADRASTTGTHLVLPRGRYSLKASITSWENSAGRLYGSITAQFRDSIGYTTKNGQAGGLRIRSIRDNPQDATGQEVIRRFSYRLSDNPATSSGALVSPLTNFSYNYRQDVEDGNFGSGGGGARPPLLFKYEVWSSTGFQYMNTTKGASVGYSEVTVLTDSLGRQGKSVMKYTSPRNFQDEGGSFPYSSRYSVDEWRGLLVEKTDYRQGNADRYFPVQQIQNQYLINPSSLAAHVLSADGWKIGLVHARVNMDLYNSRFTAGLLKHRTTLVRLVSDRRRRYSVTDTTYTEQLTRYRYRTITSVRPSATVQRLNGGQNRIQTVCYSSDYDTATVSAGNADAVALRTLRRRHVIVPVEVQDWRQVGTDSSLVGASLTRYLITGQVRALLRAELATPLAASSFTPAAIRSGAWSYDSRYREEQTYEAYDPAGNLLQQRPRHGVPTSYLWGYRQTLPIAAVQATAYDSTAFTSFEPGSFGRWSYDTLLCVPGGYTGQQEIRLTGTASVTSPALQPGTYEVLCWATAQPSITGATSQLLEVAVAAKPGWSRYRLRLRLAAAGTVQVKSISGTLRLDELRLHPVRAQMTTYTYAPLVGVTSQTDPTGRTIFYSYDRFGRLQLLRDETGAIRQQHIYYFNEL